ncbi:DUF3025 domain-containing protein [Rheinheimera salexigens]|uniref:DUF3025 domain-containing protein n=1 Tax=Rheinheimera salexigens TaxID=1628148 RepID=A0A1E7Q5W1_9GAMM|nr:DUF3025 domain-containing protein [Rheinheimera salexigens]OEY69500.1 hypothetical protein BI198_07945 [Rheinheimera salexigens]
MNQKTEKTRFTPPLDWQADIINTNPIFSALCQKFGDFNPDTWPSLPTLNQWFISDYSFVANDKLLDDGRYYENFIYATKTIPCRENNWHDFFGALIWCLFPNTKALLNQLHIAEINLHGLKKRSLLRNKLTLFDECGVIICLEPSAQQHAELLRTQQWQQSFVQQRADWWQGVKPVIFGHAMYEMATKPFIGLTAKCLFVDVPTGFSHWNETDTYSFLDQILCKQIANYGMLYDKQQLTPLPLLGVPTWYSENDNASFYNNSDYFRPLRRRQ